MFKRKRVSHVPPTRMGWEAAVSLSAKRARILATLLLCVQRVQQASILVRMPLGAKGVNAPGTMHPTLRQTGVSHATAAALECLGGARQASALARAMRRS